MKKISSYIAIFSIFIVLTSFPKMVKAENTHSSVTGTLVAPQSSQKSKDDKSKDENKDLLPSTGEKEYLNLVGLGILCSIFGGVVIYYKKERFNNEK